MLACTRALTVPQLVIVSIEHTETLPISVPGSPVVLRSCAGPIKWEPGSSLKCVEGVHTITQHDYLWLLMILQLSNPHVCFNSF